MFLRCRSWRATKRGGGAGGEADGFVLLDQRGGGAGDALLLRGEAVFADLERGIKAERLIDRSAVAGQHCSAVGAIDQAARFQANEIAPDAGRRSLQRGGQFLDRGPAVAQQQPQDFLRAFVCLL